MRTTTTTTWRSCRKCGTDVSNPNWSFCHRCWLKIRADRNSWHHQLERWSRQAFDQAELLELSRLKRV